MEVVVERMLLARWFIILPKRNAVAVVCLLHMSLVGAHPFGVDKHADEIVSIDQVCLFEHSLVTLDALNTKTDGTDVVIWCVGNHILRYKYTRSPLRTELQNSP